MFKLEFSTDNAAFGDNDRATLEHEVEMRLLNIVASISHGIYQGVVRDSNGNTIGQWSLTDE